MTLQPGRESTHPENGIADNQCTNWESSPREREDVVTP
jgi:hypothetical protein